MSVLRCDECGNFIDTDFDVEAYNEERDAWFCPMCRETDWGEEEEEPIAAQRKEVVE